MGIINNIDRKISEYGYGVMKKTKDISDIAKVSGEIKELENERDKCLMQLGEWFLQQAKEEKLFDNEESKTFIEKIKDIDENLDTLKKRLSLLKGGKICQHCKAENEMNALFCNKCGVQFPKMEATMEFCTNCGTEISQGQKYCVRCGKQLVKGE